MPDPRRQLSDGRHACDVRKLHLEESTTNARRAHATTRTSLQIAAESEVSFATYFNAFPASYWRRWTICKSVVLRIELTGAGRLDVYKVPRAFRIVESLPRTALGKVDRGRLRAAQA